MEPTRFGRPARNAASRDQLSGDRSGAGTRNIAAERRRTLSSRREAHQHRRSRAVGAHRTTLKVPGSRGAARSKRKQQYIHLPRRSWPAIGLGRLAGPFNQGYDPETPTRRCRTSSPFVGYPRAQLIPRAEFGSTGGRDRHVPPAELGSTPKRGVGRSPPRGTGGFSLDDSQIKTSALRQP